MKRYLAALVSITLVSTAHADIAKERHDIFEQFKKEFGAIKEIVVPGNVDKHEQLKKLTINLKVHTDKIWSKTEYYFPVGSDKGKTDALPAIWTDAEGFKSAIQKHQAALNDFMVIVQSTDTAEWKKGFQTLGGSCKGCHEKFRKD